MLLGFTLLCFASLALGHEKVHHKMSREAVEQIFQTTPDAVPDYEVTQFRVSRLTKRGSRSVRSLHLKAFGGDMKLWLQPAEGILAGKSTPVFTAKKKPNGRPNEIIYEQYTNGLKNIGTLLEDPAAKTSMLVKKNARGKYSFNGIIGSHHLVVRSLPASISEELAKNSSTENQLSEYHIVFKREFESHQRERRSLQLNETVSKSRVQRNPPSPSAIPPVVYPEIMLVTDYGYYTLNGNNVDQVLAFAVTFWHGVDLMYRSFEEPKFRFNIARIIVAIEAEALHYIWENRVKSHPEIINAFEALSDAQDHYYDVLSVFPESSYDAVITLTRYEMSNGDDNPDILGLVPLRGRACLVDRENEVMKNVGIIKEIGSFDGILTAAHEFGHLLGAIHDDWVTCPKTDGYIMSSHNGITEHSHDFSVCTVEDVEEFLNTEGSKCLHNPPTTTEPLPRKLPGKLRDRDYQCRMLSRGKNCYAPSTNHLECRAVYCFDPADPKKCLENREFAPADGAFCAQGKVCLHGQCVTI